MNDEQDPHPNIARLLELKQRETPPPGFHDRLRSRVMRSIRVERAEEVRPWWSVLWLPVSGSRFMWAANGLAAVGIAFLGTATFHVLSTSADAEAEVEVYAALPLPAEVGIRNTLVTTPHAPGLVAQAPPRLEYRPLPAQGILVPMPAALHGSVTQRDPNADDTARQLFRPPSRKNPAFILVSERIEGR
ncbi:MAG: hypothetical protein FJ379_00245 [Verrucomicrobia bacterium]|nr:hypothetical protein [Verrucomicrobiota bacterium]